MERENFTRDKANKDIGSQEAAIKDTTRAALLKHLKTSSEELKSLSQERLSTQGMLDDKTIMTRSGMLTSDGIELIDLMDDEPFNEQQNKSSKRM